MSNENNKVDINKHEIDIETLKKQNVNDLLSIKELYRKLKETENKISQIKYINNTLVKKLEKEYLSLEKLIIDENAQAELSHKINTTKTELKNNINKVSSQMENKLDTKANAIDVFNKNEINTKIWNMSNLGQDVKEAMTGGSVAVVGKNAVLNVNIVDNQITPNKLGFGKLGKNKFDGTFLTNTTLGGDGSDGTFTVNNSEGGISALVRVKEGVTYTISVEEGHDRFRIGECAAYPEYNTKVTKRHFADNDNKITLQAREGMQYFIIYLSSSSQSLIPSKLQVEEGAKQTRYCKPTLILDYEDETIPQNAIIKDRYQIGYQLGIGFNILTNEKIISVSEEINIIVGEKRRYNLVKGTYSYSDINAKIICVLANSDTKMLEFCKTSELINKGCEYDYLGIINNESQQIFINGNYAINGYYIKPYTDKKSFERNIIAKEVNSNFTNTSSYITPNTTGGGNALNDLYALWDDLVNKSNGYITKSLLGKDSTELPIYRYDFKPFAPQNNTMNITFPKVIFLGGIHGHERYCNYEDYRFFKELVENWTKNDVLEYLRFNVHFIVVPVQCPWGYQNKSRINSNGVNINRNHESEWKLTEKGNDYSGTAPMTEIETQLIDNLLSKNKDAIFAIDHHNFNSFAMDGHIAWFGSRAPKTHKTIFGLCNFMDGYTKKKFPWILTDNAANKSKNLYCLKNSVGGGLASTMWLKHGIQGIIYETVPSWSFSTDTQKYKGTNEDLQNLMVDLLGNLLLTVVKNNDYLISK